MTIAMLPVAAQFETMASRIGALRNRRPMLNAGYDVRLASGAIAAGGTLGILIPPSTLMVIYGIMTETSIAKMFAAGVLPAAGQRPLPPPRHLRPLPGSMVRRQVRGRWGRDRQLQLD